MILLVFLRWFDERRAAASAFGDEEEKSGKSDKQRAENIRDLEDGDSKKPKVLPPSSEGSFIAFCLTGP